MNCNADVLQVNSQPTADGSHGNHLYVGLSSHHRVSRTFRSIWYLKALTHPLPPCGEGEGEGDVHVMDVSGGRGVVTTDTQVFYISKQYSLVFVLDMTPSMRSVVGGVGVCMWMETLFCYFYYEHRVIVVTT